MSSDEKQRKAAKVAMVKKNLTAVNRYVAEQLNREHFEHFGDLSPDEQHEQQQKRANFDETGRNVILAVRRKRTGGCCTKHCSAFNGLLLFLIILGVVVLTWDSISTHILFAMRLSVVCAASVYDLTRYYRTACLISNPLAFDQPTTFDDEDCRTACASLSPSLWLSSANGADNQETRRLKVYGTGGADDALSLTSTLFEDIAFGSRAPIIESHEASTWPISNKGGVDRNDSKATIDDDSQLRWFIEKTYLSAPSQLNEQDFCFFDLRQGQTSSTTTVDEFFQQVAQKRIRTFAAIWENCGQNSSKRLRRMIRRPAYLPSFVEMSPKIWVFLSSSSEASGDEYINLPATLRFVLLVQVHGKSQIKMRPVADCLEHCSTQSFTLDKGQTLISSDIWLLEFKPIGEYEHLILILLAQ